MAYIILIILLLRPLIVFDAETFSSTTKNIEIQLVIPDEAKQIESTHCLNLKVLIINHTDTIASFFEDWNSWGYFNISLEVKSKDSIYRLYKNDRDWPKNFPSFKSLFPGDTLTLNFMQEINGCPFPQLSDLVNANLSPSDSIKVIYHLKQATLEDAKRIGWADPTFLIKYKYKKVKNISRRTRDPNDWIIIDSIDKGVPIYQTFPLARLESNYYKLY